MKKTKSKKFSTVDKRGGSSAGVSSFTINVKYNIKKDILSDLKQNMKSIIDNKDNSAYNKMSFQKL
jgi:hypothetical protein